MISIPNKLIQAAVAAALVPPLLDSSQGSLREPCVWRNINSSRTRKRSKWGKPMLLPVKK